MAAVKKTWASERPACGLPASTIQVKGNRGLAKDVGGLRREAQGSPAPADTHELSKGASLTNTAESPRTKRLLQTCQEGSVGGCCWHQAGRGPGLSAVSPPGSLGTPCLSDIMDENRVGFQMFGQPRPALPSQLDPPETGSLLSAAFYRTIKPKVQARSLRPVIKKSRLCFLWSSLLPTAVASTARQSWRLLTSTPQPHKDPVTPKGALTCPGEVLDTCF